MILFVHLGFSLSVSVLATRQVTNTMNCTVSCLQHEACKSFNYEHDSSGSTHACELLDKVKQDSPSSYVARTGFTHYEAEDLCGTLTCQHGGVCKTHCDGSFYCACPANRTGKYCELDVRIYQSCSEVDQLNGVTAPGRGFLISTASKVIEITSLLCSESGPSVYKDTTVFCHEGWALIARFSNTDGKNWMEDDGGFWYTRETTYGNYTRADINEDMLSEGFWLLQATTFQITKSDDPTHSPLLRTIGCLGGKTFRQKMTRYGQANHGTAWASDSCQASCGVTYFGNYATVAGFGQSQCDGSIQSSARIGFFCHVGGGDGAVLMIGGGGDECGRADHGIGITESNRGAFATSATELDFGDNAGNPIMESYSLNLWVAP